MGTLALPEGAAGRPRPRRAVNVQARYYSVSQLIGGVAAVPVPEFETCPIKGAVRG